ncbi:MAG: response regulator [Pyrinomonadaceae bacterium MAG19_C2-C3]|nr:response regulator [Pyrinomonadaceae bacterium MAG19_C2-C3]
MHEERNRQTILIVDDSDDIRSILAQMLEIDGYHVEQASDGTEALSTAERIRPNLILMDLRMPMMNGIAATRQLHEHAETREIPVVIVSGLDSEMFRDAAFSVGCAAFLTKPFSTHELQDILKRLLPQHESAPAK